MGSFGSALVKIVALIGGALIGTIVARWVDDALASQSQTRSDYDKNRYERGLAPLSPQPASEDQTK